MKTLRRRPSRASRLPPLIRSLGASAVALALACPGVLPAATALAGTRSHAHHSTASALPPSSFVETANVREGKKHKGNGHGTSAKAGSRQSSAPRGGAAAHEGKASKSLHGHTRQPVPADDPIPMSRASHHAGREDRTLAQGRATHKGQHRGQPDQSFAVSAAGRRTWKANFGAMRASAPPVRWQPRLADSMTAAGSPAQPFAGPGSASGGTQRSPRPPQQAFAEGVSHPDDDERLPRVPALPAQAMIGTAQVMTAPISHPQSSVPAAQPQVVQGFGSEVAIAPADPGSRPGGTRRRDHPISASALPGMTPLAPPATLEERDAITEAAVSPAVLPEIYDRDGRLLMPAPLKGSREVLVHQNTMAANDGLGRIQDDGELDRLRADHELVNFPVSGSLRLNEDLPSNRRCARPWTVLFATDIARDFYERFHQPLQVNSAVRTVSYQMRLQRVNGNAAAVDGDGASPHLTGQAIDLGKRGMSAAQLAWMRDYLMPIMAAGNIDVEEEFQQACFHISVYRRYAGARIPAHEMAQVRPGAPA